MVRKSICYFSVGKIVEANPLLYAPPASGTDLLTLLMMMNHDELLSIAHQPQDFIVSCHMYGADDECDALKLSGGTPVFSHAGGICYNFNYRGFNGSNNKAVTTRTPGPLGGLHIILDTDSETYIKVLRHVKHTVTSTFFLRNILQLSATSQPLGTHHTYLLYTPLQNERNA